ncbi:MAG: Spy/CpxP family protein refolding chaperone [Cyanobacteria bacterium P01_A01_bin.45]
MKLRNLSIPALLASLVIVPISANAFQMSSQGESVNASVNSSLIAQAQNNTPGAEGKRGRRGDKMQKMFEQLNLTTEQQEQVKSIREKYKADNQGLRQEMRNAKEQMDNLMAGDASDSQLRQQYQTVRGLKQQLGEKRFEMKLEIREVLTQEQREKLAELKKQRREKRGSRRGRRNAGL